MVALILEEHTRYGWGARKIWKRLHTRDPKRAWPARSTIFDILARHDRVRKRRVRTRWKHPGAAALRTSAPTRCGRSTSKDGLPDAIRSDNGSPFASTGIHGLNGLNVWWLQLGITHQRITPGSPQENGAHERLHKTLKARATKPPAANLDLQQRLFNAFQAHVQHAAAPRGARRRHPGVPVGAIPAPVPRAHRAARVPGPRAGATRQQLWHIRLRRNRGRHLEHRVLHHAARSLRRGHAPHHRGPLPPGQVLTMSPDVLSAIYPAVRGGLRRPILRMVRRHACSRVNCAAGTSPKQRCVQRPPERHSSILLALQGAAG